MIMLGEKVSIFQSISVLPRRLNLKCGLQAIAATSLAFSFISFDQAAYAQSTATSEEEIIKKAIEEPLKQFNNKKRNRHFCQIVISEDGKLHPIPGLNILTSSGAGGRPGRAKVTATNGSYRVNIDSPLGFNIAPTNGNNGVTFSASFSANGATNFSNSPGQIAKKIKKGTTNIEAHLSADRAGDPFPAGNYQAQLVLRCE